MLYQNVIIDGNNLYEKNFSKHKYLTTKLANNTTLITGGIFGFLKSLNKIEKKFLVHSGKIYILFDNTNSKGKQRKYIDPDYKLNRIKKSTIFIKSLNLLQYLLANYKDNYVIVYKTSYEADDLVKPILKSIEKKETTLLISEDHDWARLIDYHDRVVHWFARNKIFDSNKYKDQFGYFPTEHAVILYKTIRGDVSDNIPPGVPGIRENILLRLISEYNDIYDLFDNVYSISYLTNTIKESFLSHKTRLILNYQLIDFQNVNINDFVEFIIYCKFNKTIVKMIYKYLKFNFTIIDDRFDNIQDEENITSTPQDFFKIKKLDR